MKNFLFAFDFKMGTMNEYILDFLKDNKIDYFYQFPGVIVADLFGTDEYYKIEIEDVVNDRKEVYYCTDTKYKREGLERRYPLKERAITIGKEPCYAVKVDLENNDSFTTKINACKQKVFDFYIGKELLINNYLQNIPSCAILSSNISNCIGGKNGYTC